MKTKTKLTLWVGLLFLLIILLSTVGIYYSNVLKKDTHNIMIANYKSIQYGRNMLLSLENYSPNSLKIFELNLIKQENNISENGENEATKSIRLNFEKIKKSSINKFTLDKIRQEIFNIIDMNMLAIQRKTDMAKATANEAVVYIAITGTFCFLIAFSLLINLPSNIANPIRELTECIIHISANNYSERVHFESNNEFGQLAKSFNTMADKLEEYNKSNIAKIMLEKKRIETLINNMLDPVIGFDENLKIIFANEEAIKICDISKEDIIGISAVELSISNDLIRILIQDLFNNRFNNNIDKTKTIKIFKDNKECYFKKDIINISTTPLGENNEKVVGHVIILRNITEYKELDSAKTNFLATVSHEFKTPISSIKMSLQLLQNEHIGKINNDQKNLIESVNEDANRLLKITSELLNITQVESGNIQLSIIPTSSCEILKYAIKATKHQAEQKNIKIEFKYSDEIPDVLADKEKTTWVLINIISNAIRYSFEDSSIFIRIEKIDNFIEISIKDSGQGIAPQYIDKIFNKYFRIPGTSKEGTGLGLAISKEFVEAQGGKIIVNSELGVGSIFSVKLKCV